MLEIGDGRLVSVFLRVMFLAPIAGTRAFFYNQALYFTEIKIGKGAAPTESVLGRRGVACARQGVKQLGV
jgi:hypothetical protein